MNHQRSDRYKEFLASVAELRGRDRARAKVAEVMRARDEDGAQEVAVIEIDGLTVRMTDINQAGVDMIRLLAEVTRDGQLIHRDQHFIINPPLLALDASGDMIVANRRFSYDPIRALAETVIASGKCR